MLLGPDYHNDNQDLKALYEIISPHLIKKERIEDLLLEQLSKQYVWAKLFPKDTYNDLKIRRLCSDLTKSGFLFLRLEYQDKAEMENTLTLMKILSERRLDKHYRGMLRSFDSLQGDLETKNADYYLTNYQFESLQYAHAERDSVPLEQMSHLEKADYNLEVFYWIQKLKHFCDYLSYQQFVSSKVSLQNTIDILDHIGQSPLLKHLLIQAYYRVALMMRDLESEVHFHSLRALLEKEHMHFSKKELKTLFIYLNNYCITTKINAGDSRFFKELFQNYRFMLEHELMVVNETIASQDFKNIITVGLRVGEYEWVEFFIQEYAKKLSEENQQIAMTYNLAKLYFHQKKYDQVIEHLREVAYNNNVEIPYSSHVYTLGSKQILLKTYYELDEILPLDSLIESFRTYIRRSRIISKETRMQYLSFLKYVKKLSRQDPKDKEKVSKLKKEIIESSGIAQKGWLLEKIASI